MNWEKELDIEIQALVSQLNKLRKEKVKSNRPPESATSLTAECEPPRVPQPDAAPRVDRAKKSAIRKQLRRADGDISESAAKRSRPETDELENTEEASKKGRKQNAPAAKMKAAAKKGKKKAEANKDKEKAAEKDKNDTLLKSLHIHNLSSSDESNIQSEDIEDAAEVDEFGDKGVQDADVADKAAEVDDDEGNEHSEDVEVVADKAADIDEFGDIGVKVSDVADKVAEEAKKTNTAAENQKQSCQADADITVPVAKKLRTRDARAAVRGEIKNANSKVDDEAISRVMAISLKGNQQTSVYE